MKKRIMEFSGFLILIGAFCIFGNPAAFFLNNEFINEETEYESKDKQQFKYPKKILPHSSSASMIWNITWGGSDIDEGYSVWGDGTYLYTVGMTDSYGAFNFDLILMKWDPNGNKIWNVTYGGSGYEDGYAILGDGTHLYTIGCTNSFGAGNYDFMLVKWDLNGNLIWSNTWGGSEIDFGYSLWLDGTYIYTVGVTESFGSGFYDLALVKWDPNGNKIWNITWGGSDYDDGFDIWGDGTYLYTVGNTESFGAGNTDLYIAKWDKNGTLIWNTTWGGLSNDLGYSIWGDEMYIYAVGTTYSFDIDSGDLYLVKCDTNGNHIWNTTWGSSEIDEGYSIWGDGTYIYTSGSSVITPGIESLVLVKWDLNGNQILNVTHSGSVFEHYFGYSIWGDGGYIFITGSFFMASIGDEQIFLTKFYVNSEPFVNSPDDISYIIGTTGQIISWIATDTYILTPEYKIYRNGVINETGSWSNAVPITLNLDPYTSGTFNYTIYVFDGYGGKTQDEVIVTVTEKITPEYANNIIWNTTWGGSDWDDGYSIWGDETYIYTVGGTTSFGLGDYDLFIVKWDKNGNKIWNITWGGTNKELGSSIWGDGTYIYVIGYTRSFGSGFYDIFLGKWDLDGNKIWNITWGGTENDYGFSLWGDGTYLYLVGSTRSFGAIDSDLFLGKWDLDGNKIWNITWGGTGHEDGYSIWGDGTYLYTTGSTTSFGAGKGDLFLVKWDLNGNRIWNTTWGTLEEDEGYSIWGDETYIYTLGSVIIPSAYDFDLFLVKWDEDGNQIWNTTWGGSDYDLGLSVCGDDKYIYVSGTTDSFGTGGRGSILLKYDLDGNLIFNILQNGSSNDNYEAYLSWLDGIYLYTFGSLWKYDPYDGDALLTKFNVSTDPYVNSPQDISYIVGTTGQNISWTALDSYILKPFYLICQNGMIFNTGSWSNGTPITLNLDTHIPGIFDYTIYAFDGYGGVAQDNVIVTVTTDLSISPLPDIIFIEHQTQNVLSWNATDSSPLTSPTYIIYQNGTSIAGGSWNITTLISLNMQNFDVGIYNITVIVYDGYGGTVKDEVITTITQEIITDNNISVIGLSNYSYEFNSTNNKISWMPMTNGSFSSYTYTIYRNGISIASGPWISGSPITINIDDLPGGTYNYTIVVIGDSVTAQNTTIVTVTGGPSEIGNGGIPGYNLPLIIFTFAGFIAFISLFIRKKMQMN